MDDLRKIYEEFNRSVDKQNRSNVNQLKLTDLQGRVEQIRAKTTEFQATLLQKQIQLLMQICRTIKSILQEKL